MFVLYETIRQFVLMTEYNNEGFGNYAYKFRESKHYFSFNEKSP